MFRTRVLRIAPFIAPLLLAAAAQASTLTLNGAASASVSIGSTVTLDLAGAPNRPAFVLVDTSAGPTLFDGELVPLGFTPQLKVALAGLLNASGHLSASALIPDDPSLVNLTLHLAGVVADPADANGKDWSNAATLTIKAKSVAGAEQGVIVGEPVTLDGGSIAGAGGVIPPGTSISWVFDSMPPGSAATLQGANTITPSFTADVAGDFILRATVVQGTHTTVDTTRVHCWSVQLSGMQDGGFTTGASVSLVGNIAGAAVSQILVDGVAVPMAGNTFGPVVRNFAAGEISLPVLFELRHADGSAARRRFTFFQGSALAFTASATDALGVRLDQKALDRIADHLKKSLAGLDMQPALLALPNIVVANQVGPLGVVIFSATLDFQSLAWNQAMGCSLVPSPTGILATVTINNVAAGVRVFGKLLDVPYDLTGTQTSNPIVVTTRLVSSVVGGQLQVTATDVTVTSQNLSLSLPGFLGSVSQLGVIKAGVQTNVEAVVGAQVSDRVRGAMQDMLASFAVSGNLAAALGADAFVSSPITAAVHDATGLTLRLASADHVGTVKPGSPAVTAFRVTSALLPPFPAVSPSGQPFGVALGVADDFANQAFACGTAAGLLEGDLAKLIPMAGEAAVRFTSDQLDALFPGGGFDLFPPGTLVVLRSHGTVPPVLRFTQGAASMARLELRGLHVECLAPSVAGDVPLLRLALDGHVDVNLRLGAQGQLVADIVDDDVSLKVLRAFPGAKLAAFDAQAGLLVSTMVNAMPQFATACSGLPVPSPDEDGLVIASSESAFLGAATHAGFFGELQDQTLP